MQKPIKKNSGKRNKEKEQSKRLISASSDKNEEELEEKSFGGIPERDFKKNLGCG